MNSTGLLTRHLSSLFRVSLQAFKRVDTGIASSSSPFRASKQRGGRSIHKDAKHIHPFVFKALDGEHKINVASLPFFSSEFMMDLKISAYFIAPWRFKN